MMWYLYAEVKALTSKSNQLQYLGKIKAKVDEKHKERRERKYKMC